MTLYYKYVFVVLLTQPHRAAYANVLMLILQGILLESVSMPGVWSRRC